MMKLLAGLMDRQVLQRNARNVCEAMIVMECEISGKLEVRVLQGGNVLSGWDWLEIADIQAGEVEFILQGMPVGGPYTIFFRLNGEDEIKIEQVLVGDIWILGGQSNMEGVGFLREAETQEYNVRAFYMNDHWDIAKEPIHVIAEAIDPIHAAIHGVNLPVRDPAIGVGPGISFGKRMLEFSGAPQGLICCAHGGASMTHYTEGPYDRSGLSLYSAILRRFWKIGQRVAGVVWYQGCNEACTGEGVEEYTRKMVKMVTMMRNDFGRPELPFIMAQLATMFGEKAVDKTLIKNWNSIREQQRKISEHLPRLTVVPAIDLLLTDPIHLTSESQKRMGRRLADAAWTLINDKKSPQKPIRFNMARWIQGEITGNYLTLEVLFDNVIGSLKPSDFATGFTLTDDSDNPLPLIFRTDLDGSLALLRTTLSRDAGVRTVHLYYGFSSAAHCNITDDEDRSLPAFGPIALDIV